MNKRKIIGIAVAIVIIILVLLLVSCSFSEKDKETGNKEITPTPVSMVENTEAPKTDELSLTETVEPAVTKEAEISPTESVAAPTKEAQGDNIITPTPTFTKAAAETPIPSKEAKATATPVPTKEAKATTTPVPTKAPVATNTPKPTSTPKPTNTPKPTEGTSETITHYLVLEPILVETEVSYDGSLVKWEFEHDKAPNYPYITSHCGYTPDEIEANLASGISLSSMFNGAAGSYHTVYDYKIGTKEVAVPVTAIIEDGKYYMVKLPDGSYTDKPITSTIGYVTSDGKKHYN